MTSITEVARLAGVSTATASRVVSSADYPVSPATRARVLGGDQLAPAVLPTELAMRASTAAPPAVALP